MGRRWLFKPGAPGAAAALRNRPIRYRARRTAPGPTMPDMNTDALKTRLVDLVNQHAKLRR